IVLGTGVAALFSVPALSSARRVPPLRVLRRGADPLVPRRWARLGVGAPIVAGGFALAPLPSPSLQMAAVLVRGMAAAALVLAGAARLLAAAVVRAAKERVRVVVRHGLASLARPGAGTLPALTALGLGVLVVVAIALVQRGLAERLRADLP